MPLNKTTPRLSKPVGDVVIYCGMYRKQVEVLLKNYKATMKEGRPKGDDSVQLMQEALQVSLAALGDSLLCSCFSQCLSHTAAIFPGFFITHQPLPFPTVLKRSQSFVAFLGVLTGKEQMFTCFSDGMPCGHHRKHLHSFPSFSLSHLKCQSLHLSFTAYFFPYSMGRAKLPDSTLPPQSAF